MDGNLEASEIIKKKLKSWRSLQVKMKQKNKLKAELSPSSSKKEKKFHVKEGKDLGKVEPILKNFKHEKHIIYLRNSSPMHVLRI